MKNLNAYIIIFILSCFQLACGGGGGQDGTGRPPSNERQVTSVGTITSDDTLTVNGVEYDTSNAIVTIDNESGTKDELELGQIVVVNGTLDESGDTGIAESISFNTNVLGPVSSVSPADNIEINNSFVVLGQTINVTPETIYAGSRFENPETPIENSNGDFDNINVDDHLRIVGFISAADELVASYIESITIPSGEMPGEGDNPFYEVNGPISNLDITARTFNVNDLVVDYSDLVNVEQLENGILVEILGSSLGNGGELLANSVVVLSEDIAEVDARLELEGFITVFDSAQSFEINGLRIESDINTKIVGGAAENIALNKRIEVEGDIDGDGILVAERIIILASYLTSHQYGERLDSRSTTLTWANVNADEYRLTILGEGYVFFDQNFDAQTFSVNVDNLPENGAALAVTLYTRQDNLWLSEFYYLTTRFDGAKLISHSSGDTLRSDEAVFEWTDVDADEYRLVLNNASSFGYDLEYAEFHNRIYDGSINSVVVSGLPLSGLDMNVELFTRRGKNWSSETYELISAGTARMGAEIINFNDELLGSTSIKIDFLDVGAYEYHLELYSGGERLQTFSLFTVSQDGSVLSANIDNLPRNGVDFHFRLITVWQDGSYSEDEVNLRSQSTLQNAELLNYSDGDTLMSREVTFEWTDLQEIDSRVSRYRIDIYDDIDNDGSYGRLLYRSFVYDNQVTMNHLPIDGRELRIVLYTSYGRGWGGNEYFLTSVSLPEQAAELISHSDGDILSPSRSGSIRFDWNSVNADAYRLMIRNVSDDSLIVDKSFSRNRSYTYETLPSNNEPLLLTLVTQYNTRTYENNYNFTNINRPESVAGTSVFLVGTSGDDILIGSEANDIISGGAGDDQLFGGPAEWQNSLRGGGGNDSYFVNLGDGNAFITDTWDMSGSNSSDSLLFGIGIDPDDLILTRTTTHVFARKNLLVTIRPTGQTILLDSFYGLESDRRSSRFEFQAQYIETFQFADGTVWDLDEILSRASNLNGTASDDIITLANFGSSVDGKEGDDDIVGGLGNDNLLGGLGNDYIDGRAGEDTITTGGGRDVVFGGMGDDVIIVNGNSSSSFNHTRITGGFGDDTVYIQHEIGSNVTIIGSVGNDTYRYFSNAGNVAIGSTSYCNRGNFNDRLIFDDGINSSDVTISRNNTRVSLTINDTGSVIELGSIFSDRLSNNLSTCGIDSITFSDGVVWDTETYAAMANVN